MSTENENKSSYTSNTPVNNTEKNVPALKVPIFRGDTLDGDEYIRMIKITFRSNAMLQFLDDPNNCDNSPYYSGVFASRLRDSIAESDILFFLDTELDRENNCANVWIRI